MAKFRPRTGAPTFIGQTVRLLDTVAEFETQADAETAVRRKVRDLAMADSLTRAQAAERVYRMTASGLEWWLPKGKRRRGLL